MNCENGKSSPGKTDSSRAESASVMLEFVVAFPVVLVLVFACIQFAHLWIARMVVHYAAFCAARSALVCKNRVEYQNGPGQAARNVCTNAWIALDPTTDTTITTVVDDSQPEWNVTAEVQHTFSLITPLVGPIIAWGMNPWDMNSPWATPWKSSANTDALGYPTITFRESVTLPKPYVTIVPVGF